MRRNNGNESDAAILIAYGSNLKSRPDAPESLSVHGTLDHIAAQLKGHGIKVNKISRIWGSQAWPDPTDPPYRNAVLWVTSEKAPDAVMKILHQIESESGRVRTVRNAPRVLDLDLIAYGRMIQDDGNLILPHPRAHERGFVMGPLAEILPDWVHPVLQETAESLYGKVTIGGDAQPLDEAR